MYRVKGVNNFNGLRILYDFDKWFLTRFFAKRFYAKKCKNCALVIIEKSFGGKWIELCSQDKR